MNDSTITLQQLKDLVKKFVEEREWTQYHNAKNLSMNIAVEAAELMEKFIWTTEKTMPEHFDQERIEIEHELIDVIFSCLAFANQYNIDISTCFMKKLEINRKKYPAEKVKGKSHKYTKYQHE